MKKIYIIAESCSGCGSCIPFCPLEALSLNGNGIAEADKDECVECGACVRSNVCPGDAIKFEEEIPWPRIIRRFFSDPNFSHSTTTKGMGRGTAEMKSNDVTGRYKKHEAGIGIELGRPSTGVRFREIEKVTKKIIDLGIEFEDKNPLTYLMDDKKKGTFRQEILNEKVLSAIVEFKVPTSQLLASLRVVEELKDEVDTVFSLFVVTRALEDGSLPNVELLESEGYEVSGNAKINIGLGKPFAQD